jgi:hypothetical protein
MALVVALSLAIFAKRYRIQSLQQLGIDAVIRLRGEIQTERRLLLWPIYYEAVVGVYVFRDEQHNSGKVDLTFLQDLPDLEHLKLSGVGLNNDDCNLLSHLSRLHTLNVSRNQIDDVGLSKLTNNEIRLLFVSATGVTGSAFSCGRFSHLETLVAEHSLITNVGFDDVCSSPRLRTVTVSSELLSDQCVQSLLIAKGICEVNLIGHFSAKAAEALEAIPRLRRYRLFGDNGLYLCHDKDVDLICDLCNQRIQRNSRETQRSSSDK